MNVSQCHPGLAAPVGCAPEPGPFPPDLLLTPTSRWPTRLPEATIRAVLANPSPASRVRPDVDRATRCACQRASIVLATFNGLVFSRLCLESLLANNDYPDYEVI